MCRGIRQDLTKEFILSKVRTGVNSMCEGFKWKSPTLDEIKRLKEVRENDSTIYYIFIDEKRNQK